MALIIPISVLTALAVVFMYRSMFRYGGRITATDRFFWGGLTIFMCAVMAALVYVVVGLFVFNPDEDEYELKAIYENAKIENIEKNTVSMSASGPDGKEERIAIPSGRIKYLPSAEDGIKVEAYECLVPETLILHNFYKVYLPEDLFLPSYSASEARLR